jgi:hypothetical protein
VSANRQVENDLRRWLRSHFGVIGWREAIRLGASPDVVKGKLRRGEWERVFRGVYRDTAAPHSAIQMLRAAFVVAGPESVISHASAAWLWGLIRQAPAMPELSVRHASGSRPRPPGVIVHRSRDLDPSRASLRQTMPVTNPLRTLADMAGTVPPALLTEAVDRALASKLVTVAGLVAELARLSRKGRPGVRALRRELAARGFVGTPHPSVLESRLHRLAASLVPLGIPHPSIELSAGLDGEYRLDLAWPDVMLAVEVDGYVWHFSPEHVTHDEARRRRLRRMGWTLLVYTWVEVVQEPERVAREIADDYRACHVATAR